MGTRRKGGDVIDMHEVKRKIVSEMKNIKLSFIWTLKDFFAPIGETKIESPIFRGEGTGQHEWSATCMQNVVNKTLNFLDFGLTLRKSGNAKLPGKPVEASFDISIVDLNGRVLITKTSSAFKFTLDGLSCGIRLGTVQDVLDPAKKYLVNDGKDLQVLFDIIAEAANPIPYRIIDYEPSIQRSADTEMRSLKILSQQMQQFLPKADGENLEGSDIDIISETGTKFPAFSNILSARSPVFKAMFKSCMKESLTKTVKISDFSDEVIRGFLEYIYTAQTEVVKNNPVDMIRLADQYEVWGLVRDCENQLVNDLTIENAAEIFILAHLHSLIWLQSQVTSFIKRNDKAVMKTESFEKARKENSGAMVELLIMLHNQ